MTHNPQYFPKRVFDRTIICFPPPFSPLSYHPPNTPLLRHDLTLFLSISANFIVNPGVLCHTPLFCARLFSCTQTATPTHLNIFLSRRNDMSSGFLFQWCMMFQGYFLPFLFFFFVLPLGTFLLLRMVWKSPGAASTHGFGVMSYSFYAASLRARRFLYASGLTTVVSFSVTPPFITPFDGGLSCNAEVFGYQTFIFLISYSPQMLARSCHHWNCPSGFLSIFFSLVN